MLNQATSQTRPAATRRRFFLFSLVTSALLLGAAPLSAQAAAAPLAVTTLAGQAGTRQATNGTGNAARFYAPSGIVVDASGNLIVADTCNNIFRKVTPAGVVTTFAGSPIDLENRPINVGSADGNAADASFHIGDSASTEGAWGTPIYTLVGSVTLAIDGSGNIYAADTLNNTIRKITAAGVVSTIAGNAGGSGTADGNGSDARFLSPSGVAIDAAGNLYVTDSGNNTIRKITPAGVVSTFVGLARSSGTTDGTGAAARFSNPSGIVADSSGNLYVTDSGNHSIRKITPGGTVSTLAGNGASGSADGTGAQARFNSPNGIAIDSSGNLYVADTSNHTIRKITSTGVVSTVAGVAGTSGSADGTGNAVRFNEPYGITVDGSGTVYISDTSNNTIRKGVAAATTDTLQITSQPPRLVQVNVGKPATFKVVANGTPSPTYQWTKDGNAISGANSATYTIGSAQFTDAGNYAVTVTSGTVTLTSASSQLQVFSTGTQIPPIVIVTQPADQSVNVGQSVTLSVEVSGTTSPTYQWQKDGANITGATSASYTISSAQASHQGVYTVVITDGANTASTTGATLTVQTGSTPTAPSITGQPSSQTVTAGGTATFTVTATGSPAPSYQWRKDGALLSNSANISGTTTATLTVANVTAADAGAYTVSVTNSAGAAVSNSATLTVNSVPPSGPTARLSNLSVRTNMAAGQTLIVGLSMSGGSRGVLVRGIGPKLADFGVSPTMADPRLELYSGSTMQLSNDNWDSSLSTTFASVGAFGLTVGSKDAAFVQNLDGGYTVQAKGTGAGIVLVEAYDTGSGNSPRLTNVSARNRVGTGDDVLIAGFAITGTGKKKLLIRGIGPKLTDFGVDGVLTDPKIEVYNSGNSIVAANDNWDASLASTFSSVGAFGLNSGSKDAALIVELDSSAGGATYSVVVKGADGGTGEGLVEIYELP